MYLEAAAGHKNTQPTKSWPLVWALRGSDGLEIGHTWSWAGPWVTRLATLGQAGHQLSTNVPSKCCHLQNHLQELGLVNQLGKEGSVSESPASCSLGLRRQALQRQCEQHWPGLSVRIQVPMLTGPKRRTAPPPRVLLIPTLSCCRSGTICQALGAPSHLCRYCHIWLGHRGHTSQKWKYVPLPFWLQRAILSAQNEKATKMARHRKMPSWHLWKWHLT